MPTKGEKDQITGREMTGHEWDGIRELDTPLPKWWLYVLYATIAFAIVYCILYPSVPLIWTHTHGVLGYTNRGALARSTEEAVTQQAKFREAIGNASLEDIRKNPDLLAFAETGGRAAFNDNCAPCHRAGGAGAKGYPNLADDDWLWGGTLAQIHQTITHGIRNSDPESHQSQMPRFGADGLLTREQISDVADFVMTLSGQKAPQDAAQRGSKIFADNCAVCHGEKGTGNQELGAKNLADGIWLYGGDKATIVETITNARNSSMPAWGARLDPTTIKMLAVYVHSLGGGK
ncbi:MAG: cytochrome-c oxidase, cbb3-type subunit III [Alphaproteobacteria bacterium]|nr:cytochrome-c oxidase, cbb3-type subunit III [Alphaproteobacteria bacterium]